MTTRRSESVVEEAALAGSRASATRSSTAPRSPLASRGPSAASDYATSSWSGVLRQALARLNPDLPPEALDDAFRKLTRADAPSLIERNRAVHRMLVDGDHGRVPPGGRLDRRRAGARDRLRGPRRTTTGWRSTSSPWSRASTPAGRTSCSS